MKMFWAVVLFCGFLSLSVGEKCMEAIIRINKEKLEAAIPMLLSMNLPDLANKVLNKQSKETDPASPAQNPSSSPSMTCRIEKVPECKVATTSDKEMEVNCNVTLIVETEIGAGKKVDIEIAKDFTAVFGMDSDGFSVKSCSSPPGDGNIKESLTGGVLDSITKPVKDQICSIINQNWCDLVKTALEGPTGDMIGKLFVVPEGYGFCVQSMEDNGKHITISIRMMKDGEGNQEECCNTNMPFSWEPQCPMKDDAICDITIKKTEITENIKSNPNIQDALESAGVPVPGNLGDLVKIDVSDCGSDIVISGLTEIL